MLDYRVAQSPVWPHERTEVERMSYSPPSTLKWPSDILLNISVILLCIINLNWFLIIILREEKTAENLPLNCSGIKQTTLNLKTWHNIVTRNCLWNDWLPIWILYTLRWSPPPTPNKQVNNGMGTEFPNWQHSCKQKACHGMCVCQGMYIKIG